MAENMDTNTEQSHTVPLRDLENRTDIDKVVQSFYAKVRQDPMLGPIFNSFIPAEHWPAHLQKIGGFWEFRLFNAETYEGRPLFNHLKVDRHTNYGLTREHFAHWVELWVANMDRHFAGEVAEQTKTIANNMAYHMGGKVLEMRPQSVKMVPKVLDRKPTDPA
ncbi:group III truncated hemoglobin [Candidatus Haliotispira prima]|uniref:Group III truncated hemoglobin n=1 Tax=Candidatus Haliotispira prima TaxID=3034016 RepID=A0ABY8MGS3_9SPIO|nr:group III truncated hemoglobin [Candidatus Haliotispira prima]